MSDKSRRGSNQDFSDSTVEVQSHSVLFLVIYGKYDQDLLLPLHFDELNPISIFKINFAGGNQKIMAKNRLIMWLVT